VHRRYYDQIIEDSPQAMRSRERATIERAIAKLEIAKSRGAGSAEAIEALAFLRKLWTAFIEDLANDDNALPIALRASLISIGLWVRRECELIESGRSENFGGLIDVNRMIADGLT
jgi:flagellar protein FlaF